MSKLYINRLVEWVFLQVGMKCETKVISYSPGKGEGHSVNCSCQLFSMSTKVSCLPRDFAKKVIGY